ncbi:MAG: hypothetical protein ABI591_05405 [Kofleriaceae bacterium]
MGDTAIGKITDAVTGWQFTGVRDPVRGFDISDVFHDHDHLASSIRVERVAVTAIAENTKPRTDPDNFEFFGLGDCVEVKPPTIVKLAKGTTDPLGYYAPVFRRRRVTHARSSSARWIRRSSSSSRICSPRMARILHTSRRHHLGRAGLPDTHVPELA